MKHSLKQALSLLLALIMMIGLMPGGPAFAEPSPSIELIEEGEETEVPSIKLAEEPDRPSVQPADEADLPSVQPAEPRPDEPQDDEHYFTTQPESGSYDPGSLTYEVMWETNFTPVKTDIMKKNPTNGFFDVFSSDNNSGQVDWGFYSFPAHYGSDTYMIRAYYGTGSSDYIPSNEFMIDTNLLVFNTQPVSGSYDPNSKQYTIAWGTSFAPVQIEIKRKNTSGAFDYFESFDTIPGGSETWGVYNFPAHAGTDTYKIYAYYGTGSNDFVASNEFMIDTNLLVFNTQPVSGSYDPNSKQYTIAWGTSFAPVQIEIKRKNTSGAFDYFESFDTIPGGSETWGVYNFPAHAGTDTYKIYAYYGTGSNDFVASNEFTIDTNLLVFNTQPVSGSYDPNSKQYTIAWGTSFAPVQIEIKRKNTSGAFDYFESFDTIPGGSETWGVYNFPAHAGTDTYKIYAYYGTGSSDYVPSNEFTVTSVGAFQFTTQPQNGGFDPQSEEYLVNWDLNFVPVEIRITKQVDDTNLFNPVASFSNSSNATWGFFSIPKSFGIGTYRIVAFFAAGSSDYVTSNDFSVYAVTTSGNCGINGDNLTWSYDPETHQLIISGTGQMAGYWRDFFPWTPWRSQIQTVVIEEGVEDVSAYAFENCSALTSVDLPSTLTGIEDYAFSDCPALADANINMSQQDFAANVTWDKTKNTGLRDAAKHFLFVAEGQAGPTLTWKLSNDGVLRFSGSGAMYNWTSSEHAPWYPFRNQITDLSLTNATTVGDYAFQGCSKLSSVTIHYEVTALGAHAFGGCTGLTTVNWNAPSYNDITEIPAACFSGCTALESFTIPTKCTVIGYAAFSGCDALTTVSFYSGNALTEVGKRAFYSCDNLTNISLPETVTSLGEEAFYNCRSLTSFPLPSGLTSLGVRCFTGCSGVTGVVTIPAGITEIPERCFLGCSGFYKLVLTPKVTRIEDRAFSNCTGLTSVKYDGFRSQWEAADVAGGNDLLTNARFEWLFKSGKISGTEIYWQLFGSNGKLVIYGTGDMKDYPEHPEYAPWYPYFMHIEILDINSGVERIGVNSFRMLKTLTQVYLPQSLKSVGQGAFNESSALTDVWYNGSQLERENNLTIDTYNNPLLNAQWHYTEIVRSVYGPDGGVDLSWSFDPDTGTLRVFWDEDSMDQIEMAIPDFPNGSDTPWVQFNQGLLVPLIKAVRVDELVTRIGDYAFDGLEELTDVQIASTVTSIGEGAFRGCINLISITIPDTVETLDKNIFWNCPGLETVHLPAGLTEIPDGTFYGCEDLHAVYIPGTVGSIGQNAFNGCLELTDGGDVYFNGTSAQWGEIIIGSGNDALLSATIHFVPPEIAVNAANFPDPVFRAYVKQYIDEDKSGYLTDEERLNVSTIYCENKGIGSLQGIQFFPWLIHLDVSGNDIGGTLDLTANPMLQTVNVSSCGLSGLVLTDLEELMTLNCSGNDTGMSAPDLSTNLALDYLDCSGCDGMEGLDLSANVNLTELNCSGNQLDSLDLSANPILQRFYCSHNNLTALDLSANTWLRQVDCSNNLLTSLTLGNPTNLITLECYRNEIPILDLTGCPYLVAAVTNGERSVTDSFVEYKNGANYVHADPDTILRVSQSGIPIDEEHFPDDIFRDYVADELDPNRDLWLTLIELEEAEDIDCSEMGIESIQGVEHFTSLQTLDCSGNKLTQLSLDANTWLKELNCSFNEELSSLDVSALIRLEVLSCEGCKALTALDVSANTALRELDCHECALTSLTLDSPECLRYLDCSGNVELAAMNLSGCLSLRYLMCYENALAALNLSECPVLEILDCYGNRLTSLDLHACQSLRSVDCSDNALTSLSLGFLNDLKKLYCNANRLSALDLPGCPHLVNCVVGEGAHKDDEGSYWDYYVDDDFLRVDKLVTLVTDHDGIPIDAEHFPDPKFREYVHDNPDTDGNWYLSNAEIAGANEMYLSEYGIASLEGIQYFTELKDLDCSCNQLAELDLSANTKLTYLICDENPLTSLDVGAIAELSHLSCCSCRLQSLDLSANTSLSSVFCEGNEELNELLLPPGTKLDWLYCDECALTSLDVRLCTGLTIVHCEKNALTELILGEQTKLKHLYCNGNSLARLDIFECPMLMTLVESGTVTTANGVVTYRGSDVLCVDEDTVLVVDHDGIPVIEEYFPDPKFRAYVAEHCDTSRNGWLNAAEINAVTTMLLGGMGIGSLEGIQYFTALDYLECYRNNITELDLSGNTLLTYVCAYGNPLTTLDLTANTELDMVEMSETPTLTSIRVAGLTKLTYLDVHSCGLTELDITGCPMWYLWCEHNPLIALTLGEQRKLELLYCFDNRLELLDISLCPHLLTAYLDGPDEVDDGVAWYYGTQELSCEMALDADQDVLIPEFYEIELDASEYGTLTADYSRAVAGQTVTITAVADENCNLENLFILAGTEHLTPTFAGENTWTFVMPACKVTVVATFVEMETIYVEVIFDAQNDTEPECWYVEMGGSFEELPVPEREDYTFLGWFDAPADSPMQAGRGNRVTTNTAFYVERTVYAHWRKPGDIDGNDRVDTADVVRLAQYVKADSIGVSIVFDSADVDNSGRVDTGDVVRLAQYVKADGHGVIIR